MRFSTFIFSAITLGISLNASKITSHSQAGQDEFVCTLLYDLLNKYDTGYYLEIGAGEPISINNTYALEKECGWKGLSIDISTGPTSRWRAERDNPLLSADALTLNYHFILKGLPSVIDYLSLDVDGYYDRVLAKVMQTNYTFKIITIEHDAYRFGNLYQEKEREILTQKGYYLLCANVSLNDCAFEDWWIHPSFFSSSLLEQLSALDLQNKDYTDILKSIKTLTSNLINKD